MLIVILLLAVLAYPVTPNEFIRFGATISTINPSPTVIASIASGCVLYEVFDPSPNAGIHFSESCPVTTVDLAHVTAQGIGSQTVVPSPTVIAPLADGCTLYEGFDPSPNAGVHFTESCSVTKSTVAHIAHITARDTPVPYVNFTEPVYNTSLTTTYSTKTVTMYPAETLNFTTIITIPAVTPSTITSTTIMSITTNTSLIPTSSPNITTPNAPWTNSPWTTTFNATRIASINLPLPSPSLNLTSHPNATTITETPSQTTADIFFGATPHSTAQSGANEESMTGFFGLRTIGIAAAVALAFMVL